MLTGSSLADPTPHTAALAASSAKAGNPPTHALPGARSALALLILINLFNYIDRYVLAAVVPYLKQSFFGANGTSNNASLDALLGWCQLHLGFKPENALIGVLST